MPDLRAGGPAARNRIEPDLAKWNYGDYEGLHSIDIRREHPEWNVRHDGCPHGETPVDLSARVDRLVERRGAMRGNVALFSHGQLGAVTAARWIGLPLIAGQHFALHPASISILGHEPTHPDRRAIELWNETPTLERGR